MHPYIKRTALFALLLSLATLYSSTSAWASLSVTTFQVITGKDGKQYFVNNAQKAVPLPGPGVSGNTVQILHDDSGHRWYAAADRTQVAVPRSLPQRDLRKVVAEFLPLTGSSVPLGKAIYWSNDGPYYFGPGHSQHIIDQNDSSFSQLTQWHDQRLWDYDWVDPSFVSTSATALNQNVDYGHPSWNKHRQEKKQEQERKQAQKQNEQ